MPGHVLELAQTHVHLVGDAVRPSHPLSSPSPAFSLSQHQGLFQWVSFFASGGQRIGEWVQIAPRAGRQNNNHWDGGEPAACSLGQRGPGQGASVSEWWLSRSLDLCGRPPPPGRWMKDVSLSREIVPTKALTTLKNLKQHGLARALWGAGGEQADGRQSLRHWGATEF